MSGRFEEVKEKYKEANQIVGDIIKVTPSSKVVGDLAIFMVKNNLTKNNLIIEGEKLSFPDSVVDYCKGIIGQPEGGIPRELQRVVLKGDEPIDVRPGILIPDFDFQSTRKYLDTTFNIKSNMRNALGYALYPRVYEDYLIHFQEYSDISKLDSEVFLHGLNRGEECDVEIEEGKVLNIKLVGIGRVKENGYRTVVFELNGMSRRVEIKDNNFGGKVTQVTKANMNNPFEIGASIPGKVIKILVKEGDVVAENDPLIVIEAMKMETNIVSKVSGEIKSIEVKENDIVEDKQLLITIK